MVYYEDIREEAREDGIKAGRKAGVRETAKKMVNNMLKENIDISLISKISGLTNEQITQIMNN